MACARAVRLGCRVVADLRDGRKSLTLDFRELGAFFMVL